MENYDKTLSQEKILSFKDFTTKCRMMDEACRQWRDFIDESPERRDGNLFTEFYENICKQQYDKYMDDSDYRDDCNDVAELYDIKKSENPADLSSYSS